MPTCHPDPQTFHHGTATARPLADCAGCHDGGIASSKASHAVFDCSLCHSDMDRPPVPDVCSRCHLTKKFGAATCTACHSPTGMIGREQVHTATPKAGVSCATCHVTHNADLGTCQTCHGRVPEVHHGVITPVSGALGVMTTPARLAAGARAVVSGTLGDAGGAPLAGAQVLLQARRFSAPGFSDVATLTTSTDGGSRSPSSPSSAPSTAWSTGAARRLRPCCDPPSLGATIAVRQVVRLGAGPRGRVPARG